MKTNIKIALFSMCLVIAVHSNASVKNLTGDRQNNWNADSLSFIPYDSATYEYNANGKTAMQHNFTYNAANGWKETSQIVYTYTNNLLTNKTTYATSSGVPVNSFKVDYTYTANNLIATEQSWLWVSNAWMGIYSYTSAYNAQQQLVTYTTANWNSASGSFRNYRRSQYSAFVSNRAGTITQQIWDASTGFWKNYTKNDYAFYQANLKDSVVIQYTWIDSSATWKPLYGTSYTYNSDTNVTTTTYYQLLVLPFAGLSSIPIRRTTYDYTNGQLTYQLTQIYSHATFQPQSSITYVLDAFNHYTSETTRLYDTVLNAFVNSTQRLYDYDVDGDLLHSLDKTWESGRWVSVKENYYWYRQLVSGLEELNSEAKMLVYPNPCLQSLTLQLNAQTGGANTLQLIDINGRLLSQQIVQLTSGINNLEINVADLAPGLFFVKIDTGKQIFHQKVLKM